MAKHKSADPAPVQKAFPRGARATPRHKLLSTFPHLQTVPTPPWVAYVPSELSFWDNQTDGDCVTAEEAFNKACANPEIFITDATVVAWATEYGFLNGANLTDVMDKMASNGFNQGGSVYGDGGYTGVDYSNEDILRNAVSIAPVKVAIDADALPQTAGTMMGWYALGGTTKYTNTDHCVSICGYGTATELFTALGVPLPTALNGLSGYLIFTWNSIGFVDYNWIMSTVVEAWLRNPSSLVNGNPIPNPGPTPSPVPTPTPTPSPTPTPVPTPVPPTPPTPTPTPVPGTVTAAQFDAAVAAVEAANPHIAKIIIAPVAAAIKAALFRTASNKPGTAKVALSGLPPLPPPLVATIMAALDAAAVNYPQYAAQIAGLKALLTIILPSL